MLLYLITQKDNTGYDVYLGAVVTAESEHAARHTHPGSRSRDPYNGKPIQLVWVPEKNGWLYSDELDSPDAYPIEDWVPPEKVIVKLIGVAVGHTSKDVVLSSFRAG